MASHSNRTIGGLKDLTTESRNPASTAIDTLSPLDIVRLINAEDATVAAAVGSQVESIARSIEVIADRMRHGGRLIYLGAGTSGRLGVLDATECPPTFNTRPEQVLGIIAGGHPALVRSVEGAEDHGEFAVVDLQAVSLSSADVVVGIATSGRTPYVVGGLEYARSLGAFAVGLSCNRDAQLAAAADLMIVPVVGPEVISGSTRLKAGTATKMVLNMLTTGTMVRLGKTYGNLMVDLRATNTKLTDRARRIVAAATGVSDEQALELLNQCRGEVKTAIVAHQRSVSPEEARQSLARFDGHLREALGLIPAASPSESPTMKTFLPTKSPHGCVLPVAALPQLVVGVDGGGTKTVAWIATRNPADGDVLGRGAAGPSNTQGVGREEACRNIVAALAAAFADARLAQRTCAALCLALAGADRTDERASLVRWAQERGLAERVEVVNDAEAVLEAGSPEGWGIALISGTGSFCFGRTRDGRTTRAGGWGFLLGDEGSGYAIAAASLRAATRAADGRGPETQLLGRLLGRLGLQTAEQLIPHTYQRLALDRASLAELADITFSAAEAGDTVAFQIVERSASELAELVLAAARKLQIVSETLPLVCAGGVLVNSPLLQDKLREQLAARSLRIAKFQDVVSPAAGAVTIARRVVEYYGSRSASPTSG